MSDVWEYFQKIRNEDIRVALSKYGIIQKLQFTLPLGVKFQKCFTTNKIPDLFQENQQMIYMSGINKNLIKSFG